MNTRAEGGGNGGEVKLWEEAAVRERVAERESRNWLTHPTTFFPPSSPFQFDTSVSSPRCQNSQAAEENKSDKKKGMPCFSHASSFFDPRPQKQKSHQPFLFLQARLMFGIQKEKSPRGHFFSSELNLPVPCHFIFLLPCHNAAPPTTQEGQRPFTPLKSSRNLPERFPHSSVPCAPVCSRHVSFTKEGRQAAVDSMFHHGIRGNAAAAVECHRRGITQRSTQTAYKTAHLTVSSRPPKQRLWRPWTASWQPVFLCKP